MNVDKDELVNQMEAVIHNLSGNEDTQGLADIIRGWVLCVNELSEEEPEVYSELHSTLTKAISDAKGHQPYRP